MHLSRRLVGPIAALALILSMGAGPASAQPNPTNVALCNALFTVQQRLPELPAVQQIFQQILVAVGCEQDGAPV